MPISPLFLTPAADHLLKHVAGWKREIIQRLSLEKNIVFIGVHNRRADWAQHYQVVDGSSVLVDEVHFNAAFEIYRYLLYFVRLCSPFDTRLSLSDFASELRTTTGRKDEDAEVF